MSTIASSQRRLAEQGFDGLEFLRGSLVSSRPWDSIIDFASHPSFCGKKLYPRQKTLLKLIHLETENMTAYDVDVIEEWRTGFLNKNQPEGVQPDIWERVDYLKNNGYTHFPHVQAVLGRRASKGVIGGVLGAERVARFYSLDDWQDYYGITPGKDGYGMVVATNQLQASRFQFADIRETIEGCGYLKNHISTSKDGGLSIRTPADRRLISKMTADGVPVDREIASLNVLPMASSSASGRGGVNFMNFFDEFAFMITGTGGTRSSEEVYESYSPSLDQFGKDSFTFVPSSPFTKVGKFYDLYVTGSILLDEYLAKVGELKEKSEEERLVDVEEGLEDFSDPEMLIVQLPSWGLYEDWEKSHLLGGPRFKRAIQYSTDGKAPENLRMRRLERRNPEKFKVERRGQFASVIDAYLNPQKVEDMFKPLWDGRVLSEQTHGKMMMTYSGHADPGRSNANFAMAIAHLEDAPPDEHGEVWPHVIFDYLKVWRPQDYEDKVIDYVEVQHHLSEMFHNYPGLKHFSFDQWNSAGFIANLRQEFTPRVRVQEVTFTRTSNVARAEKFKSALNLGWVHAYRDNFYDGAGSLLENELLFLQEKNGDVVKQEFGPVTTKDLADTVMETTVFLLSDALDRWTQKLSQMPTSFGSTDVPGLRSGREQVRNPTTTEAKYSRQMSDLMNERRRGRRDPGANRLRGRF